MKKLVLLTIALGFAVMGLSQNTFELTIPSVDGVQRSAVYAVETESHGFIVSCHSQSIEDNDMLLHISAEGELLDTLLFQIDDKDLKYCALFKHPDDDSEYLAIAVLSGYDDPPYRYNQHEIAFLKLDENLNLLQQDVCDLGDKVKHLATVENDTPKFILEDDGTLTMAAHIYKDRYSYLFGSFSAHGEMLRIIEDSSVNELEDYLFSFFVRNCNEHSYGIIKMYRHDGGGDFYYSLDSSFNLTREARLTAKDLRVEWPDTTYAYKSFGGNGAYYNDTSFLVTSPGTFYGFHNGFCNHLTLLNDNLDVVCSKEWDCATPPTPQSYLETYAMSGLTNALCVTDDAIYHCGTIGENTHWLNIIPGAESTNPIRITVSKYDKNMNLKWRRYYGYDGYYDLNSIYATSDGGCIITGVNAYHRDGRFSNTNTYILKLNENGYCAIGENAESIAKPYYCYPNPAKDNIYIELSPDVNCQSVELYDLEGRLVETFPETSPQTPIDISKLNTGAYLFKLKMSDGTEYTERIVKE